MPAKQTVTDTGEVIEYTPFGTPIKKERYVFDGVHEKLMAQFGLELDKETGTMLIVSKDPIDLDEVIQSYRDQCGMEYVQKLLARGLASPEDFAAQPIDYGDSSQLPDNINDAYQQSLKNAELGVNLGQFKTASDIDNYIIAQVKAQLANSQTRTNEPQTQTEANNNQGDNK